MLSKQQTILKYAKNSQFYVQKLENLIVIKKTKVLSTRFRLYSNAPLIS